MPVQRAEKSLGVTLTKTSGTPVRVIADLTSIGEFGVESDEIDVTTLDSTGGYKEYIPGMKDAGEVSIAGIIKSPDSYEDMQALADSQQLNTWRIQFPSGAKWDFTAFVKSMKEGESTVDGVRGFTGSLRISGKPIYSAASLGVSA